MGRPAKSSKAPGNSPKTPASKATRSTDAKKPTKSTSETTAPKSSKSTAAKPSQSTSETPAPKPSRSNAAKPSQSTSETPAPKPSQSNAAKPSKSTSETPASKPSKSNAAKPPKSTSKTRTPKPSKSNAAKPSESTSETWKPPVKKVVTPIEQVPPKVYVKNCNDSNNNIVLFFNQAQRGRLSLTDSRRMRQLAVIKDAKTFKVIRMDHIFERRVTSLTWHPTISNLIGVASKGGGMMLARIYPERMDVIEQYPGIGPGGSILALKFHPSVEEAFFTASLDGTVCYRNYQNKLCIQYLSTGDYTHWFTSFDLSEETGVMLAGDTKGIVTILNKDGSKEAATKIQKTGKVNHIEFCPRNSRLFVTASGDKCVKLWDLRKFDQKAEPIFTFLHERPINSAYFRNPLMFRSNQYLLPVKPTFST